MKNSKKTQRNWIIISIVVISVLIASFIVYLVKTSDVDNDTPPTLSLDGTTYKGLMTDLGGYLQYESDDTCEHDVSLDSHMLKAGTGLYYATEDLSIQDIVDRINCVPYNKILIAYWDPVAKTMYTYPEGPYIDTELITDLNFTIPALHSFTIISKKDTWIGGVNTENEPIDIAPLLAANPNAVSDMYGWLADIESGWVLIPRAIDSDDTTAGEYERIGEFLFMLFLATEGRVEKSYIQMKGEDYDFELAWEADEVAGPQNYMDPNISENDVNYMVWIKLSEAPEDCGGEDATHVCITNGSNPAVFLQTGDEACGNCTGIEASCHNINGGDPDWISTGESCSSQGQDFQHIGMVNTTNCAFRAICSNLELVPIGVIEAEMILLPEEESPKENFCSSSDEDDYRICVSTTGNDACASIGTCINVRVKDQNDTSPDYGVMSSEMCDYTIDSIYESFVQGFDWNIRAFCDPCGFADETHACITSPTYSAQSNGITTGDAACQYMGLRCVSLEYYSTSTGIPGDGVYSWYVLEEMPCDSQIPDDPQTYIPYANIHEMYSVRAECEY